MYNEVIKVLREDAEWAESNIWEVPIDLPDNLRRAADALEKLSNNPPKLDSGFGEWIPVTERLPKCDLGAEVGNIEWISHGMVHAGCFGRWGKYRDAYFRTWTDAGEGMDAKDADYWRAVTLPEPPAT